MNRVDENAARWRQAKAEPESSFAVDAMVSGMAELERDNQDLRAHLADARKALQKRSRTVRLKSDQPGWLKFIIYPIGFWILAKCVYVCLLGGPLR